MPQAVVCDLPGPDQTKIKAFVEARCYEKLAADTIPEDNRWGHQDGDLSGATVVDTLDGTDIYRVHYTAHGFIKVYYSPGIDKWINPQNPPAKVRDALANNDMIVALEFAPPTQAQINDSQEHGDLQRILSMVRWTGNDQQPGPHDGWFWSKTDFVDSDKSRGMFGDSRCISCHVSAKRTAGPTIL